jgi:uncharacterized protein YegP (UPF0339 family)
MGEERLEEEEEVDESCEKIAQGRYQTAQGVYGSSEARNVQEARCQDREFEEEEEVMAPKIETFQGEDEQWYWRLVASNGQIISIGGEGHPRRQNAVRAAENVKKTIPDAEIADPD